MTDVATTSFFIPIEPDSRPPHLPSVSHSHAGVNARLGPRDKKTASVAISPHQRGNLPNDPGRRYEETPRSGVKSPTPCLRLGLAGDPAPPSSQAVIGSPEEFEASGAGVARDYRAFRIRGRRIELIRLGLVTGIMTFDAPFPSSSTARPPRGVGSKVVAAASVLTHPAFLRDRRVASPHRVNVRDAGVPIDAGSDKRFPSQPIDMAATPLRRPLPGPASLRPSRTGELAHIAMSRRVSHGQQNAHRCISPGRDPGGGASR